MGRTATETAREVEQTRQQLGEKVNELAARAPRELRELGKRLVFGAVAAIAVLITRRLVDRAWTKLTGEEPPTRRPTRRQRDREP